MQPFFLSVNIKPHCSMAIKVIIFIFLSGIVFYGCKQSGTQDLSSGQDSTSSESSDDEEIVFVDAVVDYHQADTASSDSARIDTVDGQVIRKLPENYINESGLDNYVINPGFENAKSGSCPNEITDLVGDWMCIQRGSWSPAGHNNYINACFSNAATKPDKKPNSGKAYLYYLTGAKQRAKNLFYTELKGSLKAGHKYFIEFYVKVQPFGKGSDKPVPSRAAGIYLTDLDISPRHVRGLPPKVVKKNPHPFVPQITIPMNKKFSNFKGWTLVSEIYTAKGGERALIIGNHKIIPNAAKFYIDDIKVVPYSKSLINIDNLKYAQIGQTITLHNVHFDKNKADILADSHKELDKLFSVMNALPKMKIKIVGYSGFETITNYDKKLAESRAYAVMFYLLDKGINVERLSYEGNDRFQSDTGKDPDRIEIIIENI